jgi:dTDP-4-amino-4,6-dideoxygalactose transaminase
MVGPGWMDTIPAFDLVRQTRDLEPEVTAAVAEVVRSGRFVLGPFGERLEREMASRCGVAHAVGCNSGTDALVLALRVVGVHPGDEVVTTPFTFVATATAIQAAGARPVFADVEPDTLNLAPDPAAERVGPRTAAVLPVHLFGHLADMAGLKGRLRVPLIEDAAQAILAAAGGWPAGAWGEAAAVSFYPTKNLGAFGDGGMLLTRNARAASRARRLRDHGQRRRYVHEEAGYNSRLDEIQAAVLLRKLRHLDGWSEARRALAATYQGAFAAAGLGDIVRLPVERPGHRHVYHQYVVRVPRRNRLRAFLAARGIGTAVYYPVPLHLQPALADLGHRRGDFPAAERAAREVLALPMFPELRPDEVAQVVDGIRAFYRP